MKIQSPFILISSLALLASPVGLAETKSEKSKNSKKVKAVKQQLIAVVRPTANGSARGMVTFRDLGNGNVEVTARLSGLTPSSKHGFHIHQFGDISAADGSLAGGHYNPGGKPHGLPPTSRHAGDMGNLEADAEGNVSETLIFDNFKLTGKRSIVGRAVIVHAKSDTGKGQSGEAGERIGQGVIGYRFRPEK